MAKGIILAFPERGMEVIRRQGDGSILQIELQKVAGNLADDAAELGAATCSLKDRRRIARNLRAYEKYLKKVSGI